MATLKNVPLSPTISFKIDYISFDSSKAESFDSSPSTKKCPSIEKNKKSKKPRPTLPITFSDEESLKFWGSEHKLRYVAFSKRPIVPGRVVNFQQLEAFHCTVSSFFRAQKLSLLLVYVGLNFFKNLGVFFMQILGYLLIMANGKPLFWGIVLC